MRISIPFVNSFATENSFAAALFFSTLCTLFQLIAPAEARGDNGWVDVSSRFDVQNANPRRNRRTGEAEVVVTVANVGADFSGELRLRILQTTPAGLQITGFPAAPDSSIAIALPSDLKAGERVQLRLAFLDTAESGFSYQSAVETLDTIAPKPTFIWPAKNESDVARNTRLRLKFDEIVDPDSVTNETFKLFRLGSDSNLIPAAGTVSVIGDGTHVQFAPNQLLGNNFEFQVAIDGITDVAGNLIEPILYNFSTLTRQDTDRPTTETIVPVDDAEEIPVNGRVVIRFSEPIDFGTVNSIRISPEPRDGGRFLISEDWRTVTYVPEPQFSVDTRYSVSVSSGVLDLAGNRAGNFSTDFETAFEPDTTPPQLLATTVTPGQTDVSRRARFAFRFDGPVSIFEDTRLDLTLGGAPLSIPPFVRLDATGTIVTVNRRGPFLAQRGHELRLDQVSDVSGNISVFDLVIPFVTATDLEDLVAPKKLAESPETEASRDVPVDALFEALYDNPLDPALVFDGSVVLEDLDLRLPVSGQITLLDGNRRIRFKPDHLLRQAGAYEMRMGRDSALESVQGERAESVLFSFDATLPADTPPPNLNLLSIPEGATDVPRNAKLSLEFDGAQNEVCAALANARFQSSSDDIPASLVRIEGLVWQMLPSQEFDPDTQYEALIDGLCAVDGAPITPVSSTFTVGTSTDTNRPSVGNIEPRLFDGPVPTDSAIIITFSENIDITRLDTLRITALVNTREQEVEGELSMVGRVATFTPRDPLPGNSRIRIQIPSFYDYAGNSGSLFRWDFNTAASTDTSPPEVFSVSPKNGATEVSTATPIVVTFNEAIDTSSLSTTSFIVWSAGQIYPVTSYQSIDARSVRLSTALPAGQLIVVVVNPQVTDTSGNLLRDWHFSLFNTAAGSTQLERPRVTGQWPMMGATVQTPSEVSRVQLYLSEPIDPATIDGAVYIAASGIPLAGSTQALADGKILEFVSDEPLPGGELLTAYLRDSARDTNGRQYLNYDGDFFVARTTPEPGQLPFVIASSPSASQRDVPINALVRLRYSQAIDPALFSAQSISFTRDQFFDPSEDVSFTASFSEGNTVVTLTPDAELVPSSEYRWSVAGSQSRFYTGSGRDDRPPSVVKFSPRSGATDVPLDAFFSVTYDEPISRASINLDENASVMFATGGRGFQYQRPEILLPYDSVVRETSPVVEDLVGLRSNTDTTEFRTGTNVGPRELTLVSFTPTEFSTDVPTNVTLRATFSSRLDLAAAYFGTISLTGPLGDVPFALSLTDDDKTLEITPLAPLAVGSSHGLSFRNLRDLNGNSSDFGLSFTTSFEADTTPPSLIETSFSDGAADVPLNPSIRFLFSEALEIEDTQSVLNSDSGDQIPTAIFLDNSRRLLTVVPTRLLDFNSSYSIAVTGVSDIAGSTNMEIIQRSFSTNRELDGQGPEVLLSAPNVGTFGSARPSNVPLNAKFEFVFSERLDKTSVKLASISLRDFDTIVEADTSVSLSADGRKLSIVTNSPLLPEKHYELYISGLSDLAGSGGSIFSEYWTGKQVDTAAPQIESTSIADGATDVSVSARVVVTTNDLLSIICVADEVTLVSQPGSHPISASVSVERGSIIVEPDSLLDPTTTYTFSVPRLCDLVGNESPGITFSFTTNSSSEPDTTAPVLLSVEPGTGAGNVSATNPVVLTFSERVSVNALDDIQVTINGQEVSGFVSLDGNRVVITPDEEVPTGISLGVQISGISDTSGNSYSGSSDYNFELSGVVDETPPQVVNVTPANGATDVLPGESLVIEFSEPLLASSVSEGRIFLWGPSGPYLPNYLLSRDRRIVVIPEVGASGSTVAAVVVPGIEDLAGNVMTDIFATLYSTVPEAELNSLSILTRFPDSTSRPTRVDRIVLVSNRRFDPASIPGNFQVSFNGAVVNGQAALLAQGYALEFIPDTPIEEAGTVAVFLEFGVTDILGRPFRFEDYSFDVAPGLAGKPGFEVQSFSPANRSIGLPVNTQVMFDFGEPLAADSVTPNAVVLKETATNEIVPASIVLRNLDSVIEVVPNEPLEPSTGYSAALSDSLRDLEGSGFSFFSTKGVSFTTGPSSQPDLMGPTVVATSPPPGATNVGVNARVRLRYSEPINTALFPAELRDNVLFSSDGRTVWYSIPENLFPADASISLPLPNVTDVAGNAVEPTELEFETASGVDFQRPTLLSVTPSEGARNVAVNTQLALQFDEPLDPLLVSNSTLTLDAQSSSDYIFLSIYLDDENRRLVGLPQSPLVEGERYTWRAREIRDLGGNIAQASNGIFTFTTGPDSDMQPPSIIASSLEGGPVVVPLNARLEFQTDEPLIPPAYGVDVRVTNSLGDLAPFVLTMRGDALGFVLQTTSFLQPFTAYQIQYVNVSDASGNRLVVPPESTSFTTGSRVALRDVELPPANITDNDQNISINAVIQYRAEVAFDPLWDNFAGASLIDLQTFDFIPLDYSLSEGNRLVTYTPQRPLEPGRRHEFSGLRSFPQPRDIAGNDVELESFLFTTAPD